MAIVAVDKFGSDPLTLSSTVQDMALITPDNVNDLPYVTRGIYVGTGGNIKLTTKAGTTLIVPNLAGGAIYSFRVSRIWATSTTASNIVALY